MPGRYSLFWRLAGLLALFGLLLVSLHVDVASRVTQWFNYLPQATQQQLRDYAGQAQQAWDTEGAVGVERFLRQLRERHDIWAVVVLDDGATPLSTQPLSEAERDRLDFVRQLDGWLGRPGGTPTFTVPWPNGEARLVLELPQALDPRRYKVWLDPLLQRVLPATLALLLGLLLYRGFIAPLAELRRQALALSGGDLSARVIPAIARRRDELGEVAQAFNLMAERLQGMLDMQRELLRGMSHELRTPLSRLRVAGDRALPVEALRQRLEREVAVMERLVADTMDLVWMDAERPRLPAEAIQLAQLWQLLREDAAFECGWTPERMPCELPEDCRVHGHLNGVAQMLENLLRNAIRHSPADGVVRLGGRREGRDWLLWVEDQGPGVDDEDLQRIFEPFVRLDAARPDTGGFGLGLSLAKNIVALNGGRIWAENREPGLRVSFCLAGV